jgi:hypothetical protein
VVGVVSALLLTCGVITAALGTLQMGVVQRRNNWARLTAFDQSGYGTSILILGALVILLGMLGFATCKCKKPCFTFPFVFFTFVLGLGLVIVGIVILGAAGDFVDRAQELACKQVDNDSIVAKSYREAVTDWYCTE